MVDVNTVKNAAEQDDMALVDQTVQPMGTGRLSMDEAKALFKKEVIDGHQVLQNFRPKASTRGTAAAGRANTPPVTPPAPAPQPTPQPPPATPPSPPPATPPAGAAPTP
jgi:hypothetical protein